MSVLEYNLFDFESDEIKKQFSKEELEKAKQKIGNAVHMYKVNSKAKNLEELIESIELNRNFVFKIYEFLLFLRYGGFFDPQIFKYLCANDIKNFNHREDDFFDEKIFCDFYQVFSYDFYRIRISDKTLTDEDKNKIKDLFNINKEKFAQEFIGSFKEDLKLLLLYSLKNTGTDTPVCTAIENIKRRSFPDIFFAHKAKTDKKHVIDEIQNMLNQVKRQCTSFAKVTSIKRKLPFYLACYEQTQFMKVITMYAIMKKLKFKDNSFPSDVLASLSESPLLCIKYCLINAKLPTDSDYFEFLCFTIDLLRFVCLYQIALKNLIINLDDFCFLKNLKLPYCRKIYKDIIFSQIDNISKINKQNLSSMYLDIEAKLSLVNASDQCLTSLDNINLYKTVNKTYAKNIKDSIINNEKNAYFSRIYPSADEIKCFAKEKAINIDPVSQEYLNKLRDYVGLYPSLSGIFNKTGYAIFNYALNTVSKKRGTSFEEFANDYMKQLEIFWQIDSDFLKNKQEQKLVACIVYCMANKIFQDIVVDKYQTKATQEQKCFNDLLRDKKAQRQRQLKTSLKKLFTAKGIQSVFDDGFTELYDIICSNTNPESKIIKEDLPYIFCAVLQDEKLTENFISLDLTGKSKNEVISFLTKENHVTKIFNNTGHIYDLPSKFMILSILKNFYNSFYQTDILLLNHAAKILFSSLSARDIAAENNKYFKDVAMLNEQKNYCNPHLFLNHHKFFELIFPNYTTVIPNKIKAN